MTPARLKLVESIRTAAADLDSETAVLRAAAELIDGYSEGYHWTGFYLLRDGVLEVGPNVGPPTPHTRIALHQGICGAAASQKKSIVVDDVHADPRFLACSLTTRSEIVVPLLEGGECLGEIDIDSNHPAFFTAEDREMLVAAAVVVAARLAEIRGRRPA